MINPKARRKDVLMVLKWQIYIKNPPRDALNYLGRNHICVECGLRMTQGKDKGWTCVCSPDEVLYGGLPKKVKV